MSLMPGGAAPPAPLNQPESARIAYPGPEGQPTGAVLVLGGGIAGMQASLDLADQGFKV